jgi:hypothetical protein
MSDPFFMKDLHESLCMKKKISPWAERGKQSDISDQLIHASTASNCCSAGGSDSLHSSLQRVSSYLKLLKAWGWNINVKVGMFSLINSVYLRLAHPNAILPFIWSFCLVLGSCYLKICNIQCCCLVSEHEVCIVSCKVLTLQILFWNKYRFTNTNIHACQRIHTYSWQPKLLLQYFRGRSEED